MPKRIIFPEKGQVELQAFEPPEPGPADVKVRTLYSLMSIGTETVILHQRYAPDTHFAKIFSFPQLKTGVQAVGVDETVDPAWAARELPRDMPVQGNFDPLLLLAGSDRLERRVRFILECFADRPHVFNLGHGIDRRTPIAHVERLLATVRGFKG